MIDSGCVPGMKKSAVVVGIWAPANDGRQSSAHSKAQKTGNSSAVPGFLRITVIAACSGGKKVNFLRAGREPS